MTILNSSVRKTHIQQYYAIGFIFLLLSLVAFSLYWHSHDLITQNQNHHHQLAAKSVTSTANEISLMIRSLRRSVRLFANH